MTTCPLCSIEHRFKEKSKKHKPTPENDFTIGSTWYEPFEEWKLHSKRESILSDVWFSMNVCPSEGLNSTDCIQWAQKTGILDEAKLGTKWWQK